MKIENLLNKELVEGFNINKLFKQFNIVVSNSNMLDKVSLFKNDRIDNISSRLYDTSEYWWVLYVLNFNNINNLAMLNSSQGVLYNMVYRSLENEAPDILLKFLNVHISKILSNLSEIIFKINNGNLVIKAGSDLLYESIFASTLENIVEYQNYFNYNKRSFEYADESLGLEDENELINYKAMYKQIVDRYEYNSFVNMLEFNLIDIEQFDFISMSVEDVENITSVFEDTKYNLKVLKYSIKELIRWCN